ncbi:hypothetical protein KDA14_03450, partial [Candidatus Saccharibacteria bacterium]|nr:hypothetical protein [Candidatus Saccharibacteria bacterium]
LDFLRAVDLHFAAFGDARRVSNSAPDHDYRTLRRRMEMDQDDRMYARILNERLEFFRYTPVSEIKDFLVKTRVSPETGNLVLWRSNGTQVPKPGHMAIRQSEYLSSHLFFYEDTEFPELETEKERVYFAGHTEDIISSRDLYTYHRTALQPPLSLMNSALGNSLLMRALDWDRYDLAELLVNTFGVSLDRRDVLGNTIVCVFMEFYVPVRIIKNTGKWEATLAWAKKWINLLVHPSDRVTITTTTPKRHITPDDVTKRNASIFCKLCGTKYPSYDDRIQDQHQYTRGRELFFEIRRYILDRMSRGPAASGDDDDDDVNATRADDDTNDDLSPSLQHIVNYTSYRARNETPLYNACRRADFDLVLYLLRNGADASILQFDYRDIERGRGTPLLFMIFHLGEYVMLRTTGNLPLDAIPQGFMTILESICAQGGIVDTTHNIIGPRGLPSEVSLLFFVFTTLESLVDSEYFRNLMPIFEPIADLLMLYGASIDATGPPGGITILTYVMAQRNAATVADEFDKIVKYLLVNGADPHAPARLADHITPYSIAEGAGMLDVLEEFKKFSRSK